jgi:hypothetical protein
MSFSSKPKKVKPRGSVRELKLVHTVNRRGSDSLEFEEVKTPWHGSPQKATMKSQHNHSSPLKRAKLDFLEDEPIPYNQESEDMFKKRQTLVILLQL